MNSKVFTRLFSYLVLTVSIVSVACNSQKKLPSIVYFNQSGDTAQSKIVQKSETIIEPGDRLSIVITAFSAASAAPYNQGGSVASGTTTTGASAPTGYLVGNDGTIRLPQLGMMRVAGMNRKQLVDSLTGKLQKFLTDPIVTVEFLNFKVTVLGEVARPGALNVPDGKISLIEAIGLAGDLTITARRDNITVIREVNGVREFGKVNLLSKDVFNSPYFQLKQNDVVYVELTKDKAAASDQSLQRTVSITTAILSITTTIIVLIVNLTR